MDKWIMVAGPYGTGAANAEDRHANLVAMNRAAWQVFERGWIPVIGVNMALPVIEAAGESQYEAVMMPLSLALASRCDAVLRIGGPSRGADQEVERIRAAGHPVYEAVEDVPDLRTL